MNKKLIAVAIAGAVVAPAAMAQGSNPVTLYGLIDLTFENVKASGGPSAVPSRNRVASQSSRLGVRGTEDLGGGTKAFFQIESQVNPDDGTNAGIATPSATNQGSGRGLASRNSGVGLQGGWGSFLIGRWDTPYKLASLSADPWGDLQLGGYVTTVHDNGNFDLRPNNVIQYWLPNINGFTGRLHYSANEGKTGTVSPTIYSGSVLWESGPIFLSYSFERHKDGTGSNIAGFPTTSAFTQGLKETGNEFTARFKTGPFQIAGIYETIKKSIWANKQKNFYMSLTYTAGPMRYIATLGKSKDGAAAGVASPKGDAYSVGAEYSLSKRTTAYGLYASVKNNATSTKNFGANSLAIVADNDPKGFGIGLRHTF